MFNPIKNLLTKYSSEYAPLALSLSLGVILLELLVRQGLIHPQIIPPPSQVWFLIIFGEQNLIPSALETFKNASLGLGLSFVCGVSLGILFSLAPFLRKAIEPLSVFFQTVPIVAIAPLLVIYFGFGAITTVASSFIVSLFPILANTLSGLAQAQKEELELFQIYKATGWETLWKLKLPRSFDSTFVGLKVSCGLALIGTIAGEFVAGGGLGALIDSARTQQRVDIIYACLCLLSFLGLFGLICVDSLQKVLLKYRPYRGSR